MSGVTVLTVVHACGGLVRLDDVCGAARGASGACVQWRRRWTSHEHAAWREDMSLVTLTALHLNWWGGVNS